MEKIPGLRTVGDASEEDKEKMKGVIESRLTDHTATLDDVDRRVAEKLEYPKTQEELVLIKFADEETNRLRIEAGAEPYPVKPENYHIIPPELYKKMTGNSTSDAKCEYERQGILLSADSIRSRPVFFGAVTLHETLHLKGHLALEVEPFGGKAVRSLYRAGITSFSAQGISLNGDHHSHFKGLNEGIVSEQERRSLTNMLDIPDLQKEKERLDSEPAQKLREKISEEKDLPLEDIFWVGENENEYKLIPYRKQREVLAYVCDETQKEFPKDYETPDDVFKEFLRAHFTGQLLKIARHVEKAFGEGSFRMLGDMRPDSESGSSTLEALRKARSRKTKAVI